MDVPLANRVRSGRKQPQRVQVRVACPVSHPFSYRRQKGRQAAHVADQSPHPPEPVARGEYRVLARKYRPGSFAGLIGQDAMVRTLSNAFASGRIAQAYMLTGVRGVGKTTTARILARALNYTGADGRSGPSLEMEAMGEHCEAIMESRHVDVIEMDAASHTGIDDVREIIEAVKYRPISARYKVYIIDEVHMLSRQAFNGLLKTLEEPPEHVKFIFATTEIRKVPVTVLSRCQRFDLRRVDASLLIDHFRAITEQEGIGVDGDALAMIARAAEGSVRDGLSLLDQAIALGTGTVSAEEVRAMLGLADRARIIDLLEHVLRGHADKALTELKNQYDAGADPAIILSDMADFIHFVTRLKVVGDEAVKDSAVSQTEIERGREMAAGLDMRALARAWQMMLKGLGEVRAADNPLAAADMVLVRLAYAADLPPPDELIRRLENTPAAGAASGASSAPSPAAPPPAPTSTAVPSQPEAAAVPAIVTSFDDVLDLLGQKRQLQLKHALETRVSLVRFTSGHIELRLLDGAPGELPGKLGRKLGEWTGQRWLVSVARSGGEETVAEKRRRREAGERDDIARLPVIRAVMDMFPGAGITAIRKRKPEIESAPAEPEDEDMTQMRTT